MRAMIGPTGLAILPVLALATVSSCMTAAEEVADSPVSAPAPSSASASAPVPSPVPTATATPAPPPAAPKRVSFTYRGELTQGGYIRGRAPDDTAQATLGDQTLDLAEDGTFFAAFDRDSPAEIYLRATLSDGQQVEQHLTISPRQWRIQRVNIARRAGGASASFMARRRPELEAIYTAREQRTGAQGWSQDFIWPVKGRISGMFGRQRIYRGEPGSYHSGIDIAPGAGKPFVAPADGVVVLARTGFSLEGGLIIIDHGQGLNSAFLHASRIVVAQGESVRQGQHIGNVGATGRATGPHLHWSLKWKASRLDPLLFTGPME